MDAIDATSAAYAVGYESISQFSREYSRFFGQPPMREIKARGTVKWPRPAMTRCRGLKDALKAVN